MPLHRDRKRCTIVILFPVRGAIAKNLNKLNGMKYSWLGPLNYSVRGEGEWQERLR